jgi:sugar phosphate isomerase/epimerase
MAPVNRRAFIGTSIAAAIAPTHFSWAAHAAHRIDRIGLQLYTVRDAMKSDFEGTLAKVAAIGYKEVEFSGYLDRSPGDVRAILDRHALAAPSAHVSYSIVEKKWPETLDAAHATGHSYLICAGIDESQRKERDGWKRAAALFNRAGEASQKAGIQFGYHNYSFEFAPAESLGGKLPYDFLLAELDPKLVTMEMDLCWIIVAGKDPLTYFDKYPGRFPLVHVKDFVKDSSASNSFIGATGPSIKFVGRMVDVGSGSIDWKRIFTHSGKAGIKHYFVENDEPKSAFDDIRASFNYLHALQF